MRLFRLLFPALVISSGSVIDASSWKDFLIPERISIRTIERGGIGYFGGYSSLDLFFADLFNEKMALLMDLRAHHLYEDTYAANVGLGLRFLPSEQWPIIGVNTYYDFREGYLDNYYQIGLGVEYLGNCWDIRINGTLPLGKKIHYSKKFYQYSNSYFLDYQKREFSFYGLNAEVGYHLLDAKNFSIYGAIGPYFLTSPHPESWGGRARLKGSWKNYISLELSTFHDAIFNTKFQGELTLSLPLKAKLRGRKRSAKTFCNSKKIFQNVQRFEIIPLEREERAIKNY